MLQTCLTEFDDTDLRVKIGGVGIGVGRVQLTKVGGVIFVSFCLCFSKLYVQFSPSQLVGIYNDCPGSTR